VPDARRVVEAVRSIIPQETGVRAQELRT
jgi:hypothetical protein